MVCTRLRPGHLSVPVGDSSRRCEEFVKKSRIAPLNEIIILLLSSPALRTFSSQTLVNVLIWSTTKRSAYENPSARVHWLLIALYACLFGLAYYKSQVSQSTGSVDCSWQPVVMASILDRVNGAIAWRSPSLLLEVRFLSMVFFFPSKT